jgi:hypothetical protein
MGHASAAALSPPELMIAGRYRVEQLLGQGGMGAVYAVHDLTTDRPLALKRLASGASATMAALFEREYHTLAGLRHPCIVEVFDYGRDDDGAFYTMERIDGGDLSQEAPMPWRDACRDLRDAASILGLLHARHLLHRDLSPRNLLRSKSGRLKLIDFGALALFGPSTELVGTPPFVAPEALRTAPLDQRSDLFALGALAYWLITGVHAFPARNLNELPKLWSHEPAPPSELLALIKQEALEPIPAELDQLILSLLRIEPAERLADTGELIDRLNLVAGLSSEAQSEAAQGYLDSKAFVGRARERERVLAMLREAHEGKGQAILLEGDPGVGRTRFLQELMVVSRLTGALPVLVDASAGARPYGAAEALLLALLRVLPEPTRAASKPYAELFGSVSSALQEALGVSTTRSVTHATAEGRVRLLNAFRDVVLSVATDRTLALFVDDAQALDEPSQALLPALAHGITGHKLLLLSSLGGMATRESSPALVTLRGLSVRLRLLPLNAPEMLELLRSVFGQAKYLERLAQRLHQASSGNPAYSLELAAHLVQQGAARYEDGSWTLPAELPPESLPDSRHATHLARVERLSAQAQQLARKLSVPHRGALTLSQCLAVSELAAAETEDLLLELTREHVLSTSAAGYKFAHEDVRAVLYTQLDSAVHEQTHLRLAQAIEASEPSEPGELLRGSVHYLRGGEVLGAHRLKLLALRFYAQGGDVTTLRSTGKLFEELYELLAARGEGDAGVSSILAMLAVAGYYADRRFAVRYGELAVETLQRLLRLDLARRLTRYLGGKLALYVALFVAGIALRRQRDRCEPIKDTVRYMLSACSTLCGTATVCIDPKSAGHYAQLLAPFCALGESHAASAAHEFARSLERTVQDRPAVACAGWRALIERLDKNVRIEGLDDAIRINYIAACYFSLGICESWRDGPECLRVADKLEQFGPMYAMSADHIRANHYNAQGDLKRAAVYRQRVEVHAVQLGTAWQVETWAPADQIKIAMRAHDASMLKRAVQELSRLSTEVPSLAVHERTARGAYLVLRGKYQDAIPLLDYGPEYEAVPGSIVGYSRTRGVLAQAYNGMGKHAEARAVCLSALAVLSEDDLAYVFANLHVQIELALAEAGLGQLEVAALRIDNLLARHGAGGGLLTLGALHEARARIALSARDLEVARKHVERADTLYRKTELASLISLSASLRRQLGKAENPRSTGSDDEDNGSYGMHAMMRAQLMLNAQSGTLLTERAARGLQLALELSSADGGFIVLARNAGEPVAHLGGDPPTPELVTWAEQSMLDAGIDEQTVMTEEVHSEIDSNYKIVGDMRYCVVPLWARQGREDQVVAALVLGFTNRVPRIPEPAVMRAIAAHLVSTAADKPG